MANGTSRALPLIGAFVVGLAAGWFIQRLLPPDEAKARDHIIRVHPDGSLSEPQAHIGRANTIAWISDGGLSLDIPFPESGFPELPQGVKIPPFEGMTHRGAEWFIRCGAGLCFSGDVNKALPTGRKLRYKYDQVIGSQRVDGMIIINP